MPIEPDEFNKGYTEGTVKGRIEKILANCKAYTLVEIIKGLELKYSYDPNSPRIKSEKGEVPIIASATPKSQSLRTTIPLGIVRQFGLKEKQRLNWAIQVMDNRMVIVVTPEVD